MIEKFADILELAGAERVIICAEKIDLKITRIRINVSLPGAEAGIKVRTEPA